MLFHNEKEEKRFSGKTKQIPKSVGGPFPVSDRNVLLPQHGHKISLHLKMPIWKKPNRISIFCVDSSFCSLTSSLLCHERILSSLLWNMAVKRRSFELLLLILLFTHTILCTFCLFSLFLFLFYYDAPWASAYLSEFMLASCAPHSTQPSASTIHTAAAATWRTDSGLCSLTFPIVIFALGL